MRNSLTRYGRELERRSCRICSSSFWCLPESETWHCNEYCREAGGLEARPQIKVNLKQMREVRRKLRDEFGDEEE